MFEVWIIWGLAAASLASGLVAGVFLSFSDFVIRSLVAAEAAAGARAMQHINREVYRTVFLTLLLGLVPVSALILVYGVTMQDGAVAALLIGAAGLYLLGGFGVTALGNVPMNRRLDAMALGGSEARAYWPAYASRWTRWNHIRALAAFGASLGYLVAALLLQGGG